MQVENNHEEGEKIDLSPKATENA
jgi:serine/threonine-protein phosphatase PP1 catalytic subunit